MMKERLFFVERMIGEMNFVTLWHWKEAIDFRLEKNDYRPAYGTKMYKIQSMVATMNEIDLRIWKGVIDGRIIKILKKRSAEIEA